MRFPFSLTLPLPFLPSPSKLKEGARADRPPFLFRVVRSTVFVLTPAFLISSATSYYTSLGSLSVFFSVVTAVIGLWGVLVVSFSSFGFRVELTLRSFSLSSPCVSFFFRVSSVRSACSTMSQDTTARRPASIRGRVGFLSRTGTMQPR